MPVAKLLSPLNAIKFMMHSNMHLYDRFAGDKVRPEVVPALHHKWPMTGSGEKCSYIHGKHQILKSASPIQHRHIPRLQNSSKVCRRTFVNGKVGELWRFRLCDQVEMPHTRECASFASASRRCT